MSKKNTVKDPAVTVSMADLQSLLFALSYLIPEVDDIAGKNLALKAVKKFSRRVTKQYNKSETVWW